MSFLSRLDARLRQQSERDLYRSRIELDSPQGACVRVGGRQLLNFCSNDYLGLAAHPAVVDAMRRGLDAYGAGAGASHLVNGHMRPHRELEERLADWTGAERVLLFSNGYLANLGLITALASRGSTVATDRLNHASLVDAGVLSRARVVRYRHADADDARRRLSAHDGERMIVTDSVFSMDGDVAPLNALDELAVEHGAPLVVDDAHGFGVLGAGRGSVVHFGLADQAILMGTLGKAVGVYGAFVAGRSQVIESLIQFARPYIYTTALPPAVAAGCIAAIGLFTEEAWRRERLMDNVRHFRALARGAGIPLGESETPIQPVITGSAEAALAASRALERRGILVTAIRPPTVPQGTARLRVTLSAAHRDEHIEMLVEALSLAIGGSERQ